MAPSPPIADGFNPFSGLPLPGSEALSPFMGSEGSPFILEEGTGFPEFPPASAADPSQALTEQEPPPVNVLLNDDIPKALREEIEDWTRKFAKASASLVANKVDHFKFLKGLNENLITMKGWTNGTWRDEIDQSSADRITESETPSWPSDYVHAPGYLVDSWVDRAYPEIFDGPEWLVVVPEQADKVLDFEQYPKAQAFQKLLIERMEQGQIHMRTYESLHEDCSKGSVFAKVVWYTRKFPLGLTVEAVDYSEKIEVDAVTAECPIIQIIPLDKILPDPKARHSNIQMWRGIGHRVDRTYDDIIAAYEAGTYNLNRDEFEKTFSKDTQDAGDSSDELNNDPDAQGIEDPESHLTVWEFHAKVPTTKGYKESVITFVTEREAEDADTGVCVRILPRPILPKLGMRPFVLAHFTPQPLPFGIGLIDRNIDLIFTLSQCVGQFLDGTRITAVPANYVEEGSDAQIAVEKNGGYITPGFNIPFRPGMPDPIKPYTPPPFNAGELSTIIQFLKGDLERRTLPDVYQGISGTQRKTAMEFSGLMEQAKQPSETRLDLFCRSFFAPMLTICLEMIREFSQGDQVVNIRQPDGSYKQIPIKESELREGRYRVLPSITRRDQMSVAKAQIIQQLLQQLIGLQPMLAQEGQQLFVSELIKRLAELIGGEGADRLIGPNPMLGQIVQQLVQANAMGDLQTVGMLIQQLAMMFGGGPPEGSGTSPGGASPGGNGTAPPERQPGSQGGPMGPEPTDMNQRALMLQMQSTQNPGGVQ